ncbi:hypothetical protein JM189_02535 [Wolbachia endosymbiont of Nasonia vitripennis]
MPRHWDPGNLIASNALGLVIPIPITGQTDGQ